MFFISTDSLDKSVLLWGSRVKVAFEEKLPNIFSYSFFPLKATSSKFKTIIDAFDLSLFLERSSKNRNSNKSGRSILMYSYFQDLFSCRILSCSLTTVDKNKKNVINNMILQFALFSVELFVLFLSSSLFFFPIIFLSFLFHLFSNFQVVRFFQSHISGNVS